MSVMIEASRTTASPAGIWAVVIVAVAGLGFWLSAVALASRDPSIRHRRVPDMPGPVLGGTHVSDCGRSVAPNRDFAAAFDSREEDAYHAPHVPAPRTADADQPQHQSRGA